jgi:hypothetical protein
MERERVIRKIEGFQSDFFFFFGGVGGGGEKEK